MANAHELNLAPHRSSGSVWERRGWDGTREVAVTRWLIGVGGGVLALEGLRRRSLVGTFLAGLGGTLAWWAVTGEADLSGTRRWLGETLARAGWTHDDLIHETSAESFPASDAPSWTATTGTGLRNRRIAPRNPSAVGH